MTINKDETWKNYIPLLIILLLFLTMIVFITMELRNIIYFMKMNKKLINDNAKIDIKIDNSTLRENEIDKIMN